MTSGGDLDGLWEYHAREWRDPAQIASQWDLARDTDPALLRYRVTGPFFDLLARLKVTLIVTREYEHLVIALSAAPRPDVSFMRLPHPSGVVVDRRDARVHLASTRNPNQLYELQPAGSTFARGDAAGALLARRPLIPVASRFYPGALYLHDLALVGRELHGNAVGENAVVRFSSSGGYERVWWPRCIETHRVPDFSRNYLQLNSIAAGEDIGHSYFSASAERMSRRRPGHRNFPVDGRGVVFSGRTGEPMARGLTRPHSARLRDGEVWVDNSGYGEVGIALDGRLEVVARLPGWTRGLCFADNVAFVGVSRVIPRFIQYAPGLEVGRSVCGVFALDTQTGAVLASVKWPAGNQIFAIDWLPASTTRGLPFPARSAGSNRAGEAFKRLFYSFQTTSSDTETTTTEK